MTKAEGKETKTQTLEYKQKGNFFLQGPERPALINQDFCTHQPSHKAQRERSPCAEPGTSPLPAGQGAGAPGCTKAAPGDCTRGWDLLQAQLEGNAAAGSPRCSSEHQRLEAGGRTSSHPQIRSLRRLRVTKQGQLVGLQGGALCSTEI